MKQAQVLSEKDMHRVLTFLSRYSFAERNRAMFMLSWLGGMRVAEIASLKISDVVAPDGKVREQILLTPQQTKGDRSRKVLLNMHLQSELTDFIKTLTRDKGEPLFLSNAKVAFSPNSLCQLFKKIYNKCGLDAATSHSGRRTFITNLAHKGVNVRVLAELAGHANISTTQRYIELNEHVLRAAVELL